MKRKCNKCGKVRDCRAHNQGKKSCKGNTQALCYICQRAYWQEYYELNKEEIKVKRHEAYLRRKAIIEDIRNNVVLPAEQKLKKLFE